MPTPSTTSAGRRTPRHLDIPVVEAISVMEEFFVPASLYVMGKSDISHAKNGSSASMDVDPGATGNVVLLEDACPSKERTKVREV